MAKTSIINLIIDSHFEDDNWVKPVLILDIDGVVNPFHAQATLETSPALLPGFKEEFLRANDSQSLRNKSIFIDSQQLNKYFDILSILTEPVWGSAWSELSNLIHSTLNRSEEWNFIDFPEVIEFGFDHDTWKLPIVKKYVEENFSENRPIIWVDDELEQDAFSWVESRNGLALKPPRDRGLTEEDWEAIVKFAKLFKPSS